MPFFGLRSFLGFVALALLGGCLQSTTPAFNDSNSMAGAESKALAEMVVAWEAYYGSPEDGPRPLMESPGVRVAEMGEMIVAQAPDVTADPATGARTKVWIYVAYKLKEGRPVHCVVDADETIRQTARDFGVEVVLEPHGDEYPPDVTASGAPEALFAFVGHVFTKGRLACGPDA